MLQYCTNRFFEVYIVHGFLKLSFLGLIIATVILTQITIACVTIYLHRCKSHRALTLHPIVSHFFRFWLWLTTGMVTAHWVAIHRKHHANTDVKGDPHSPVVLGLKEVFWRGAELYRKASKDTAMIEKYAHDCPTDWVERNLYSKYSALGITIMAFLDLFFFGIPGITIWAIQMIWIPLWAAGFINGIGHYFGYRNFECKEAATNIIPWGFWIGGEELHNNHHAYASSAKFSVRPWEFDLGWFYIKCLAMVGLAKVKKLPPKFIITQDKNFVDLDTVKAVITNRLEVMASYYKKVITPVTANKTIAKLLRCEERNMKLVAQTKLKNLLACNEQLRIVYEFKQSLQKVWNKTVSSQKELIESLQTWCNKAEDSGLEVLREFSRQIKGYMLIK